MKRNSLIRRSFCALAALAAFAGLTLPAQPARQPAVPVPPRVSPRAPSGSDAVMDATHLGSPIVLDKSWRVGITADPAASTPEFDDSNWSVRDASESIADVNDPSGNDSSSEPDKDRDFAWFRLHIKLAPNHGPIALLIDTPIKLSTSVSVGDVTPDTVLFANGREIRPEGPNSEDPERFQLISRIYDLQVPPGQTDLTLSIRTMHIALGLQAYTHFFADRALILGNPVPLHHSLELWQHRSFFEHLPKLINSILLFVLAVFLFALYIAQRGHREYLWLALFELVEAPISFVDMLGSSAQLESMRYAAIFLELLFLSSYLYFEFLVAFLNLGRIWAGSWKRWIIYLLRFTAPILFFVGPAVLSVGHGNALNLLILAVFLGTVFWSIAWLLFCVVVLVAATLRRNFEAGLLLIPFMLSLIGVLEPTFTSGMMMSMAGRPYRSPLTLLAGPVPVHFASVADFVGLLVIVLIIFGRFLRIHRDRERAASELHAARSVQELMIPQEKVKTPGFEVDSVYQPAAEVGGDFFHVQSTPDGGLLVVIGDVAGKGLKAAMNVSMLVGALRSKKGTSPAKILESLNKVLVGSESFTTCEAAWFGPNGELAIASAGHLAPYLNSQEISLPGGLPLGVLASATYDEVHLFLHPGDRVLFMSDGVVEARNPAGELFGFDRVHNLSNQSAFYIADAAKEFGQEDDITVLTVRRLAVASAAA